MGQVKVHDKANKVDVNVFEQQDGGTCPYYIFHDPITDRIAACYSIKQDIKECQEAIIYLKSIENDTSIPEFVKSSLLSASVIKYARCFTGASGGRGTTLNQKDVFQGKSQLLQYHDELMEMRTKYLAHALESNYESSVMVGYLIPESAEKAIYSVDYASKRFSGNSLLLDDFLDVLDHVHTNVEVMIKKQEKACANKIKAMNIDDLYADAITPPRKEWFKEE